MKLLIDDSSAILNNRKIEKFAGELNLQIFYIFNNYNTILYEKTERYIIFYCETLSAAHDFTKISEIKNKFEKSVIFYIISEYNPQKIQQVLKAGASDFLVNNLHFFEWELKLKLYIRNINLELYKQNESFEIENIKPSTFEELSSTKEFMEKVFQNTPLIMFILDENRIVKKANQKSLSILNTEINQIIDVKNGVALGCINAVVSDKGCTYSPKCNMCNLNNAILKSLKTDQTIIKEETELIIFRKKRLAKKYINFSVIPFKIDNKSHVLLAIDDITNLHETEIALQKKEQTFRQLVENINEIFWIYNYDQKKMVYLSPQHEFLTGYAPEDILTGDKFLKLIHPADWEKIKRLLIKSKNGTHETIEYRIIHANKDIKWFSLKTSGFVDPENQQLVFGISTDITEKKITERKILKIMLETENNEREFLAKELHDGLGATLSAINMYLERLTSDDLRPEKQQFYIEQAFELIQMASKSTREISHNLKPHILTNYGLLKSLEILIEKINGIGKLEVSLSYNCWELKIDNDIELAFYRIISELINNSLKYSKAKRASIDLLSEDNKLILKFEDNGVGFDTKSLETQNGSGLKNIETRIKLLGGTLNIESAPGKGMNVLIQLTLHNE